VHGNDSGSDRAVVGIVGKDTKTYEFPNHVLPNRQSYTGSGLLQEVSGVRQKLTELLHELRCNDLIPEDLSQTQISIKSAFVRWNRSQLATMF